MTQEANQNNLESPLSSDDKVKEATRFLVEFKDVLMESTKFHRALTTLFLDGSDTSKVKVDCVDSAYHIMIGENHEHGDVSKLYILELPLKLGSTIKTYSVEISTEREAGESEISGRLAIQGRSIEAGSSRNENTNAAVSEIEGFLERFKQSLIV